ncbi:hypothetical protein ACFV0T_22540 [Streptomyces sp. NPDC059582]|uniref:hypothetical protein n=1 Tax=Streptomyces sp. NPDC059582 TaxID=3346875 RepID=UPI003680ED8C
MRMTPDGARRPWLSGTVPGAARLWTTALATTMLRTALGAVARGTCPRVGPVLRRGAALRRRPRGVWGVFAEPAPFAGGARAAGGNRHTAITRQYGGRGP